MLSFDQLNEKMRRWVWLQGWSALRPIQEHAIPVIIHADNDVILEAPTAGGKTEAAYLPILSSLIDNPIDGSYAVLNVSPLKALINDQSARLQSMTADTDIEVTAWHGDIAYSSKGRSLKDPSGILLITPESLESLLANKPHAIENAFKGLRYVVIDEMHSFMGSERGTQLQSLLSRIEAMIGRPIPRIALSATFADHRQACEFLRPGARRPFPIVIPDAGKSGHETLILVKEFTSNTDIEYTDATALDIFTHLRGSNNLVFANSRKEAEAMALKLRDISEEKGVPNEFRLHHGSLSKTDRHLTESTLKEGALPCTAICTSTLELGIDIGRVRSIAQLVTANSVSALRQRLGRSGRRGEASVLRIYSMDEQRNDYKYLLRTNLVQNIAVVQLLTQGRYEKYDPRIPRYSTLIQQILSVISQYGGFYAEQGWQLLCRDGAFANISAEDFLDVLKALGAKGVISQSASGQIIIGAEGEKILRQRDFYTAFVTLKDFPVYDKSRGQTVGVIQYKPYVGEYILLAAQRWLVESIDDRSGVVNVSAAHTTGKMMFEGYGQEIDGIITQEMRRVYLSDEVYPYLDANTDAIEALRQARAYYRSLNLEECPVVDIDGHQVLFTWGGVKFNRTLALMYKADGHPLPQFDPYALVDVPLEYLHRLLTAPPDLIDLAKEVSRGRKLTEKFDYLLPPHLLDKKYAFSSLVKSEE